MNPISFGAKVKLTAYEGHYPNGSTIPLSFNFAKVQLPPNIVEGIDLAFKH